MGFLLGGNRYSDIDVTNDVTGTFGISLFICLQDDKHARLVAPFVAYRRVYSRAIQRKTKTSFWNTLSFRSRAK